ncbi:class II myosin [Ascosphaera atra]|nr:class II myosin [Ascosphaera atra]
MGVSRRPRNDDKKAGGRKGAAASGKPQVKKAAFETTKKKEVGVSDLTLLSKISNEAINENLKKRFEAGEIYVCATAILVCP